MEERKSGKASRALNLNTLKNFTSAFEYINNITINQVICDFFHPLSRFIEFFSVSIKIFLQQTKKCDCHLTNLFTDNLLSAMTRFHAQFCSPSFLFSHVCVLYWLTFSQSIMFAVITNYFYFQFCRICFKKIYVHPICRWKFIDHQTTRHLSYFHISTKLQ